MTTPTELKYTDQHAWLRTEADGTYTVGITDHAQEALGDVVFVQNPAVGRKVTKGEEVGVIESVKAAADIYAPLSGEIVAVNEALDDAPEKLNEDSYAAWMFRIRADDASELATLIDAAAYQKIADADQP
ncbi:MAG TPA: glycine cleavage system protein GcvH [Burkholderiales bacterium]|nr:glycine cleavage system protein GcvH [Burkholderiales bacterium]